MHLFRPGTITRTLFLPSSVLAMTVAFSACKKKDKDEPVYVTPPRLEIASLEPANGPSSRPGDDCVELGSDRQQTVFIKLAPTLEDWILRPPGACGGVAECGFLLVTIGPANVPTDQRCLVTSSATVPGKGASSQRVPVIEIPFLGTFPYARAIEGAAGHPGSAAAGSSRAEDECRIDTSGAIELTVELRGTNGELFPTADGKLQSSSDSVVLERVGSCSGGTHGGGGAAGGSGAGAGGGGATSLGGQGGGAPVAGSAGVPDGQAAGAGGSEPGRAAGAGASPGGAPTGGGTPAGSGPDS